VNVLSKIVVSLGSLLLSQTGFVAAQGQTSVRLTLQDLLSVEPIGETVLSPDGSTFALVRNGQVALLSAAGGWPVTLTSTQGGKSGLAWSPDGKRLAFISQGSLWTVLASGGNPQRLTNAPAGTGDPRQATDRDPRWSPDGRWILFTSGRRGTNSLLIVSPDGNTTTFLTKPDEESSEGRWSPDGKRIVYISRTKEYFSGRINLLNFDSHTGQFTADPFALYTSPIDKGGSWSIRDANWSPDGETLVTVLQNSGWDHLYLLPAKGGKPKQITDGNFDDLDPAFSPDGKTIAFISNRSLAESTGLWTVSTRGGEAHEAATFATPGITGEPQWSPDGKALFFHHQSATEANDLFAVSLTRPNDPRALTRVTPQNLAAACQVPQRVTWKSKDGREISGLLYKPHTLNTGAKLPAVLWIHGGPEGQDTFHLDGWAQFLAQQGYLVLEPNYRGSTGYGEAFRNLNVEDSNGGEVDDVAAGAQYLISSANADPTRIGIGGGSHGGTMVAYAVTRYPELFAAAIELYGVVDRELFVYRTNSPSATRWMMKMGGTPTEKPDVYRRANVLLSIDKVRTPLLVMHGEDDPQVPPAESAALVKALRAQHKTVFYFTYPGELHGFAQPQHRLDAWSKELAFFDHYLNPKFGTTTTSVDEVVFPENKGPGAATSHPQD
jgi:dipeptidyl aminopeptidase/acylaminoacyl peptidase